MSEFYEDFTQGIKEAVTIEGGELTIEEIRNLPAPAYRAVDTVEEDPEVYFTRWAIKTGKMTLKDILLGNSNVKETETTNYPNQI